MTKVENETVERVVKYLTYYEHEYLKDFFKENRSKIMNKQNIEISVIKESVMTGVGQHVISHALTCISIAGIIDQRRCGKGKIIETIDPHMFERVVEIEKYK